MSFQRAFLFSLLKYNIDNLFFIVNYSQCFLFILFIDNTFFNH
jgi:hypothetical protein